MRGQLLVAMKEQKEFASTHVMSVEDYKQALKPYHLSNLQVLVIALMMFEEQLPPFDHIIRGLINPRSMVSKHLQEIN